MMKLKGQKAHPFIDEMDLLGFAKVKKIKTGNLFNEFYFNVVPLGKWALRIIIQTPDANG